MISKSVQTQARQGFQLLLVLCASLLLTDQAAAQGFSYVYIQGPESLPIYVKLDGVMQPRYGKHYCVIPELAPGPIQVSILFQQSAFPEQKFMIRVPENSGRYFRLEQRGGSFSLYDVQQEFSLPANNTLAQDRVPEPVVTTDTRAPLYELPPTPTPDPKPKDNNTGDPVFLDNVVFRRDSTATAKPNTSGASTNPTDAVLRNSDCPTPMAAQDFSKLYQATLDATGDEDRTAVLLKSMDNCFSTAQVRALTGLLTMDAARMTLLQKVYPRVSDQAAFPLLDDLLRDTQWKSAFQEMVRPKSR